MPKRERETVVRLHLWLERGGETLFGLGRLQLLERIDACGSIKGAADALGMSYRAAWGKIRASEETLGLALVEKIGGNKSGCRLTRQGRSLARVYRMWFDDVERLAVERANELFSFPCEIFPQNDEENHPIETPSCVNQNTLESLKKI